MASNFFSQEDDAFLYTFELHPNLCSHSTAVQGMLTHKEKRQRRKKNKESCGDARKRNLTAEQVNCLDHYFSMDHTLETQRKEKIAAELNLDPQQIAVWFQNRRVRWRVKNLEREYNKLKTTHEGVLVEKSHLAEEVSRLKAQLCDAKRRMKMLAETSNGISCYSQHLSFSMDMDPAFMGDAGIEGLGNPFQYYDHENINSLYLGWTG